MSYWSASHYLLVCGGPTWICQRGVTCTTNIIFRTCFSPRPPDFYFPEYSVGDSWCRLILPFLNPWLISLMPYLSHLEASEPFQLEPGSEHTWYPWCTIYMRWGYYCTSSDSCPSLVLMWNACNLPTNSSWSPCSLWRVGMMMWSRDLIFVS